MASTPCRLIDSSCDSRDYPRQMSVGQPDAARPAGSLLSRVWRFLRAAWILFVTGLHVREVFKKVTAERDRARAEALSEVGFGTTRSVDDIARETLERVPEPEPDEDPSPPPVEVKEPSIAPPVEANDATKAA